MALSPSTSRPMFSRWISASNDITRQFLSFGVRPDFISMAGGLPAAEFYPAAAISHATGRALARWGPKALDYGPVEGFLPLRQHIAERMARQTGCAVTIDNVLLTAGAMQGLDLLGKILIDPGDRIVAQYPTYVGALDAWRPRLPSYEALDWGQNGATTVDALRAAKFVYTVPNYSNPTGALVSTAARQALLEKVLEAGTWLIEDDPYLPLQLDGAVGPSILELHGRMEKAEPYQGPVIYLGTLSKSIVPGLRVGWAVAAPELIQALVLAKQSADLASSMLTQAVALELLEAGLEQTHVPHVVHQYRERRDALCTTAATELGQWFEWETPPGGMFVWMRSRDPAIDTDALYEHAVAEKVAFVPGSVFDPHGRLRSAMRVNFTRNTPAMLEEGIARLALATRRYLDSNSLRRKPKVQRTGGSLP